MIKKNEDKNNIKDSILYISNTIFKNFAETDKMFINGIYTGKNNSANFRSEEKAVKYITNSHVYRGDAITALLLYLEKELLNGTKFSLVNKVDKICLVKDYKRKGGLLVNQENLSEHKNKILDYIYANWGSFPTYFNLYDQEISINQEISKYISCPPEYKEFNKLSLVEKLISLPNLLSQNQFLIKLENKNIFLLKSWILSDITKEVNGICEENIEKYTLDIRNILMNEKLLKSINCGDCIKIKKDLSSYMGENPYDTFQENMLKNIDSKSIVDFINFSSMMYGLLNLNECDVKNVLGLIKMHLESLEINEREKVGGELKATKVLVLKDKSIKSSSSLVDFINKSLLTISLEKRERDFDEFVESSDDVVYKKKIVLDGVFSSIYLRFLENSNSDIVKMKKDKNPDNNKKVTVEILSDFRITISNKLLLKKINEAIGAALNDIKVKDALFAEFDYHQYFQKMINTIRLEQKLEDDSPKKMTSISKKI